MKGGGSVKELNIRQKSFCEFYVASGNATEAAIKAGYSEKTARSIAQRMLTFVDINKYIENLRAKAKSKRIMNAIERRKWLTNVLNDNEVKMNDKLKALDILNKMDGEYTEKIQLSGEINNPFDNISSEDIKKLIENAE